MVSKSLVSHLAKEAENRILNKIYIPVTKHLTLKQELHDTLKHQSLSFI